jgi:hypothetical protein
MLPYQVWAEHAQFRSMPLGGQYGEHSDPICERPVVTLPCSTREAVRKHPPPRSVVAANCAWLPVGLGSVLPRKLFEEPAAWDPGPPFIIPSPNTVYT